MVNIVNKINSSSYKITKLLIPTNDFNISNQPSVCSCASRCSCNTVCSCNGNCSCDNVCSCQSNCSCDNVCNCEFN